MKRVKKYKSLLSAITAAFICMAGGITVFAYQPPNTITSETNEVIGTDMSVPYESLFSEKLLSDCYAISEDGTVYDFCNVNENTRINCNHDYSEPVNKTVHVKDGKGGCTVYAYSALKCTKCSDTKVEELLSTVTYMPCPH